MTKVVCIGECMVELRPRDDGAYALGFAGDAFNAAVYLKRSAPQFSVRFLTATGVDRFSQAMRATWRAEGIAEDLAFVAADATPGLYVITVDDVGERSFTYWRSASAARRWFALLQRDGGAERLADTDLVYLSGISLAILPDAERGDALALLTALAERGCKVAFDPNYRQALWPSREAARRVIEAAMQRANIILPSQDDLAALDLTVPVGAECVTTLGAEGCRITAADRETFVKSPPVAAGDVRDTSGAGDAFTGAYLAARLSGSDPPEAAASALAVAARVVTASGALVPTNISHPISRVTP